MQNSGSGNIHEYDDFLQVLLAVRQSAMERTNVAELCIVTSIDEEKTTCKIITTEETIDCYATTVSDLLVNDLVVVVFTNTDFRANLKRIIAGKNTQQTFDKTLHTKDNGIIVGRLVLSNGGVL